MPFITMTSPKKKKHNTNNNNNEPTVPPEINISLIDAARNNDKKKILESLEVGADVNFKDQRNKSALYWACFGGHADCVLQLINYGADMDAECGRQGNETPLLATIQFNHPPCLRILLDKGANFDPPAGGYVGSPVEEAILNDRVDCLSLLIEYGAKIDTEDRFGSTPLHFAANYGKLNCAALLLNNGVDPNAKDSEDMTPLDIAKEKGYTEIADLFHQNGGVVSVNNSQLSQTSFIYSQNGSQTQPLSQIDYEDSCPIVPPFSYRDLATFAANHSQDWTATQSQDGIANQSQDSIMMPVPSSSSSLSLSLSLLDSSQLSQYSQQSQMDTQDLHPMRPPRYVTPNLEIESEDLELLEEIGSGFFGKVFRAMWQGGTQVAVKQLHFASADGKIADLMRKNFRLEMEMLTALRHPNIVLFLGVCIQSPSLHLIMEYMPRGSLANVLHSGNTGKTLGMKARLKMAMDVACGMNYLHKQVPEPILHRDLKSSNLLVTEDLRVKVSDFGLARVKDGAFKVHITILAPEVLKAKPPRHARYTEKSDVYSYGLLLWELATVQPLFSGKEPKQIAMEALNKVRPTIPSSCPAPLKSLIARCWDEDSLVRPTFQDIVNELRDISNS